MESLQVQKPRQTPPQRFSNQELKAQLKTSQNLENQQANEKKEQIRKTVTLSHEVIIDLKRKAENASKHSSSILQVPNKAYKPQIRGLQEQQVQEQITSTMSFQPSKASSKIPNALSIQQRLEKHLSRNSSASTKRRAPLEDKKEFLILVNVKPPPVMEKQQKALQLTASLKADFMGTRVKDHNYAKLMLSGKMTDPLVTDSGLSGMQSQDSNLKKFEAKFPPKTSIHLVNEAETSKESSDSVSFSSDQDSFDSFRKRINRTFVEDIHPDEDESVEQLTLKLRKYNEKLQNKRIQDIIKSRQNFKRSAMFHETILLDQEETKQQLKHFFEHPPTFDCPPMTFKNKPDQPEDARFWQLITSLITKDTQAHVKQRNRLMTDFKYLSYDRGIERLLEKLQVNDPSTAEEQLKHDVFKTAGYTSHRPCGSPFTYLTLNAQQVNRLANPALPATMKGIKSQYPQQNKKQNFSENTYSFVSKTMSLHKKSISSTDKPEFLQRLQLQLSTSMVKRKLANEIRAIITRKPATPLTPSPSSKSTQRLKPQITIDKTFAHANAFQVMREYDPKARRKKPQPEVAQLAYRQNNAQLINLIEDFYKAKQKSKEQKSKQQKRRINPKSISLPISRNRSPSKNSQENPLI